MLHVRHASPHGPPYRKLHVISVKSGESVVSALVDEGIMIQDGVVVHVEPSEGFGFLHKLRFSPDATPLLHDPSSVIVQLDGVPGGVLVQVPYRCSPKQLIDEVIPDKLRHLGVHAHDCRGAPYHNGRLAKPLDYWRQEGACLQWTKLRVPVEHELPDQVLAGICALQRCFRAREDDFCFIES